MSPERLTVEFCRRLPDGYYGWVDEPRETSPALRFRAVKQHGRRVRVSETLVNPQIFTDAMAPWSCVVEMHIRQHSPAKAGR